MAVIKTLQDLVAYTNRFDIRNLAFYSTDKFGLTTIQTTQFDRYLSYIMTYTETYEVDDSQKQVYMYRPDLLSKAIYGQPNLDWLIMKLNDCESASRFIIRKGLRLISPDSLEDALQEINAKDKERIEANWSENGII